MERTRIHLLGEVMQGSDGDLWVVKDSRYLSLAARVTYKLPVGTFQGESESLCIISSFEQPR